MIFLDTHVWIWFLSNPEKLSKKAKEQIDNAIQQNEVLISSISVWEVALLVLKQRLILTMDVSKWIKEAERLPFFHFIAVDNSIALQSVRLPQPLHDDPADRIIIASAKELDVPIITRDEKILNYPYVASIW